jgi:hypothetical protein
MAAGGGFRVADVRCTGGPEGFDVPEVERGHILVAARRGAFLRREGGTGCSPHHLSRVFSQLTGLTVSQYRNRLRVSLALERVAEGEPDLAGLAWDLGFADHAHLTRTVRAATGRTPSSLRAAFREVSSGRSVGGGA